MLRNEPDGRRAGQRRLRARDDPSRPAGGHLADRIGRRPAIVLGLCGYAVAQPAIAASASLAWAVAGAVPLGLAFELYEPPSQAIIGESVPERHRVRAFSLFGAALAAGAMGAGLLAAVLGRWDLRRLFVTHAATCLACALLIHLALPRDRPEPPGADQDGTAVRPLRDRALLNRDARPPHRHPTARPRGDDRTVVGHGRVLPTARRTAPSRDTGVRRATATPRVRGAQVARTGGSTQSARLTDNSSGRHPVAATARIRGRLGPAGRVRCPPGAPVPPPCPPGTSTS
ncbi:MFS transporter [Streptomyces lavendulae]|uniref:MFS transporter n=1 Tax=Streptomyces lavendulae TaxID=1914 RepID=UPI0024A21979|nr:MFS transporter [Streptomyces lavendulae]GLW01500.1 hypothetical protein Slala05_51310 [Streptomyces lavendulae subsp. lavendulae]